MIPRIIMYAIGSLAIIGCCTWLALDDQHQRTRNNTELALIKPTTIEEHVVYPTNHIVIPLLATQEYSWSTIQLDPTIPLQTYYIELWDANNHIIPGFASKRLQQHTIDISTIDATLTPSLRVVLFPTAEATPLTTQFAVNVSYEEYPNVRLAVVLAITGLLYWTILLATLAKLKQWRNIVQELKQVSRGQFVSRSTAALAVVLFAGWFGVVLGMNIGGIQIAYVLLKLPVLMLAALVVSFSTLAILTILGGINSGPIKLLQAALNLLAITALGLASLSPVLALYIFYPLKHDAVLVAAVFFFVLAGLLAVWTLYNWLIAQGANWISRFAIPLLWLFVYGVVFLQLGWLLRPWVGVIDPVHNTVPFARPNAGNVFVELLHTIERLD